MHYLVIIHLYLRTKKVLCFLNGIVHKLIVTFFIFYEGREVLFQESICAVFDKLLLDFILLIHNLVLYIT